MKNKTKLTVGRIITAVLTLLVLSVLLYVAYLFICNINGKVAFIGKYAIMRVVSPSMEPDIPTGSFIIVRKADADSVSVNDIITFRSSDPQIRGRMNTHQIIAINDDGSFKTKGINNPVADEYPVGRDDVVGKYIKNVAVLTWISGLMSNGITYFILIIIPAVILLGVCTADVIKKAKKAKFELAVEAEVKRLREADENSKKVTIIKTGEGSADNVQKSETEKTDKESAETD